MAIDNENAYPHPKAQSPESAFIESERQALLLRLYSRMGTHCQALLQDFSLGYSYAEMLLRNAHYKNEAAIRVATHRCLDHLKTHFSENPQDSALLTKKQ